MAVFPICDLRLEYAVHMLCFFLNDNKINISESLVIRWKCRIFVYNKGVDEVVIMSNTWYISGAGHCFLKGNGAYACVNRWFTTDTPSSVFYKIFLYWSKNVAYPSLMGVPLVYFFYILTQKKVDPALRFTRWKVTALAWWAKGDCWWWSVVSGQLVFWAMSDNAIRFTYRIIYKNLFNNNHDYE